MIDQKYPANIHYKDVRIDIENDCSFLIEWFSIIIIIADKCHSVVPGHKHEAMDESIGDELMSEGKEVKLVGLIIYRDLYFDTYVKIICKNASQKLTPISRLGNILLEHERKVLMKHF